MLYVFVEACNARDCEVWKTIAHPTKLAIHPRTKNT